MKSKMVCLPPSPGSNLWRGSNNNCHVQLTVPANTLLGSISGDVNVGDINFSQLSIQNLDLTTNVGDFDLEKLLPWAICPSGQIKDLYLKQRSFSNLTSMPTWAMSTGKP